MPWKNARSVPVRELLLMVKFMETRRSFLGKIFAIIFLPACGYGPRGYGVAIPQQNTGNCIENGTVVSIESLHSPNHTVIIPKEDVVIGVAKVYTLLDNVSGHSHTITLSAGHFANLRVSQGIQVESSPTDHTHLVTVSCA